MSLVRTHATAKGQTPSISTSITTAAFTPANNSLLVVFTGLQSDQATLTPTISDSLGTLTWTQRALSPMSTDTFGHRTAVWTAPVTTGASMTVTVGGMTSDGSAEGVVDVYYYTGHNVSAPVGGTANGAETGSSASYTIALSQAPALTSEVIGFASDDTGSGIQNINVGAGFTALTSISDGLNVSTLGEFRDNSTSTSVVFDSSQSGNIVAVAIEVVAALAAGGAPLLSPQLAKNLPLVSRIPPFGLQRPPPQPAIITPSTSPVVFRKTLSQIGGRVGTRQTQGWGH